MGIARFALALPCGFSPAEAADQVAQVLRGRQIEWKELEFDTILTTGRPGMCRFAFTYWPEDDEAHRR
ncbi:hypothetical protein ACFWB0_25140 [Rhodococcus sp. NPDC060086]|uniref:hypothetical protein n=1 Tax=Rhodococcus sp. NPDC060086 TaxID=3347055 RepID=UPI00365FDB3A